MRTACVTAAAAAVLVLGGCSGSGTQRDAVADPHGCVRRIGANTDFRLDPDRGGRLTVCHYTGADDAPDGVSYVLADVTVLDASASTAVRDAITSAPRGAYPFTRCADGEREFFLLLSGSRAPAWVYNERCGEAAVLTSPRGHLVRHRPTPTLLRLLGSAYGLTR